MKRHAHIADVQYFVCSALHTLCENNVSNQVRGGAVRGPSTVSIAMRHCGLGLGSRAGGRALVQPALSVQCTAAQRRQRAQWLQERFGEP
jgi:hypothetical protein